MAQKLSPSQSHEVVVESEIGKCGLDRFHIGAREGEAAHALCGIHPVAFAKDFNQREPAVGRRAEFVVQADHLRDLIGPTRLARALQILLSQRDRGLKIR